MIHEFRLVRRIQVDWSALIADIERAGMSLRMAAECLNVSHSTIRRWRSGQEPRYDDGQALLALHRGVCHAKKSRGWCVSVPLLRRTAGEMWPDAHWRHSRPNLEH